jgi:AmmeMemoRadiSam system protein B
MIKNINNGLTFKKVIVLILVLAAAAGISACIRSNAGEPSTHETAAISETTDNYTAEKIISCKYFNEKNFRASVEKAGAPASSQSPQNIPENGVNSSSPAKGSVIGGIVPHHLLAGDMIAGFFKKVSASQPDTIVILAPNHNRSGGSVVGTGLWSWQTAFGEVKADTDLASYLVRNLGAGTNFDLLEEDHSVSALIPYIRYYMPEAKVVPVLLYGNYGMDNSIKLGKSLSEQIKGKNSLVLASVDFSHYLTPEKADVMDDTTLEAIKGMDLNSISTMGNDNLDSPPALMSLLTCMKNSGAGAPELISHSNSSKITEKWSSSATSYFTIIYHNK